MLSILNSTDATTHSLGESISKLKALLAALEDPEPEWVEEFRTEWGELEQVYAYNLRDNSEFLGMGEGWVRAALARLRELVLMKLIEKPG